MEDDEEYYYRAYSEATAAGLREQRGLSTIVGDEEDYSFDGFSAEAEKETAATETAHAYGDFIVEEFSSEVNVKKVTKLTKLSETKVNYIFSVVYLIVGVICIAFAEQITIAFPYVVGGFMALIGLVQFISAIRTREYIHTNSNRTATSLILMALSVLILVEYDRANMLIAVAWGFFGLLEGAHAFNHAFSRIARSERCVYYLAKGLVEVVLAFMLLYEPEGHITLHIIILGVNFVFDAFTMLPVLKSFLSKK